MKAVHPPRPARGSAPRRTFAPGPAHSTGLTLIEVMIALLLGLIVIGAAVAIFLSNRQAYQAGESLGRISERVRNGFEFIAADLRAAGATPCGGDADTASRIGNEWWGQWQPGGLRGYAAAAALPGVAFGTAAGARQSGTAALQLQSADDDGIRTTTASTAGTTAGTTSLAVNTSSGLQTGQLAVICDFTHTPQLFEVAPVSGNAVTANWGGGPTTAWNAGALIGRYRAVQWYLGHNDHGGTSLYRRRLALQTVQTEEIADGVTDLQLRYRTAAANALWQRADAVPDPDWSAVAAVELTLTYTGTEARVGVNGQPLQRSVRQVVELRNHNHG